MPLILDIKQLTKLAKNKRTKRGRAVKPSPKAEREFRQMISNLWLKVLFPATERIKQLVKDNASTQQIADLIETTLRWAETHYAAASYDLINKWRMSVDVETRASLTQGLKKTLGIDAAAIFDDPQMAEALQVGTMEAASLIKSIPTKYLGEVAKAVSDNYTGKDLPEGRSLLQQIQQIGRHTEKRAKLIARDQTSKLTATINQTRQQSIGVEEYIWRTVKDERVVGNPSGQYPVGNRLHGDHFHRNGKKFRWDSPPQDGHPGQAIQCRCHAEPVLDIEKIIAKAQAA